MKIAVINFSGNVGKSTVARHLLLPHIPGADLIAIESLNADEGQGQALRGRQFGELQEYLQTVSSVVVDIGASNVEELMGQMQRYRRSHEDFDAFVVPTVPALKQQQDTIATLIELCRLGVAASRLTLVFNMVESGITVAQTFDPLLSFLKQQPIARVNLNCKLGANEIYGRIKGTKTDLAALANDPTDYKALIAQAKSTLEKLALGPEAGHTASGHRRGAGTGCLFRRAGVQAMKRPSTAKEALISEALGDMAGLIDRLEKLAPVMSTAHQELVQSSHALVSEVSMFEFRMSDISQKAVELCLEQIEQKASGVCVQTLNSQILAMQSAARERCSTRSSTRW